MKTTSGRRWIKEQIASGKARQAGGIPYEEKVAAISENLKDYFEKSIQLQQRIKTSLVKIGIEIKIHRVSSMTLCQNS